ncbi:MAG: PqqD family protein [Candidatus Omnitrophota bacterium]|jgi:hypothetical protein
MDGKKVIKKSNEVVAREIEGKVILMPLYKSSKDLNCIYTLSETASHAWRLMDGKSTLGEIKAKMTQKFNVTEDKAEKELVEFVKDLKSIKAVA